MGPNFSKAKSNAKNMKNVSDLILRKHIKQKNQFCKVPFRLFNFVRQCIRNLVAVTKTVTKADTGGGGAVKKSDVTHSKFLCVHFISAT